MLNVPFIKDQTGWNRITDEKLVIDNLPITGMLIERGKRQMVIWVQPK